VGIGIACRHKGFSSPNLGFAWTTRTAVHAIGEELAKPQWKNKAIGIENPGQAGIHWKAGGVDNVDAFLVIKTEPLAFTVVMNW
jgi:hypothetical protein